MKIIVSDKIFFKEYYYKIEFDKGVRPHTYNRVHETSLNWMEIAQQSLNYTNPIVNELVTIFGARNTDDLRRWCALRICLFQVMIFVKHQNDVDKILNSKLKTEITQYVYPHPKLLSGITVSENQIVRNSLFFNKFCYKVQLHKPIKIGLTREHYDSWQRDIDNCIALFDEKKFYKANYSYRSAVYLNNRSDLITFKLAWSEYIEKIYEVICLEEI